MALPKYEMSFVVLIVQRAKLSKLFFSVRVHETAISLLKTV